MVSKKISAIKEVREKKSNWIAWLAAATTFRFFFSSRNVSKRIYSFYGKSQNFSLHNIYEEEEKNGEIFFSDYAYWGWMN